MTAFSKDTLKLAHVSSEAPESLLDDIPSIETNKVAKSKLIPDVVAPQPRPRLPAFVNPH